MYIIELLYNFLQNWSTAKDKNNKLKVNVVETFNICLTINSTEFPYSFVWSPNVNNVVSLSQIYRTNQTVSRHLNLFNVTQ